MDKYQVLIAGVGLIGGSIAKAISMKNDHTVIGYDMDERSLQFALLNGTIHQANTDLEDAVAHADIVILATPITQTIELIKQMDAMELKKRIIVTDTASVKGAILEQAWKITNPNITFIGGHPMAGSHKKGVQAAKAHLFENAIYVLSPTANATETQVEILKSVLEPTKGKFVVLKSSEHDEMTGVISHFPHLIASSLVQQAKKWQKTHTYLPNLAAGGFRDITRIASSDPKMWQDIFHHNKGKMSLLLEEWIEEMKHLKDLLDGNQKEAMVEYLVDAKDYRDGLNESTKGAIPSFYDIYVDIRDQTGAIATVVQLLAEYEISIKNIEILEVREDITGVLRLSLLTKEAREKSEQVLQSNGYDTMVQL